MKVIIALISILVGCFFFLRGQKNNVCKTFGDYYTNRDTNPNCYYNPDIDLTIPEIIKNRGYPLEVHKVTTDDDYILTLFRIKHGKNDTKESLKPVLLIHGLGVNCGTFVTSGNKSLAFILADNGYDVWLGNYRGTIFSKHNHFNRSDGEFWNFALNELIIDTKDMINFVYLTTNKKISVIGFSLSTAMFFSYSSIYPEDSLKKVKVHIAMAPIFFIREFKSVIGKIPWSAIQGLIDAIVTNGRLSSWPASLRRHLCLPYPFQIEFCGMFMKILGGQNNKQLDPETLPISVVHDSDAISYKSMHHLLQLFLGNDGSKYDYGSKKNIEVYGTIRPLWINLSNMQIPTYFLSAKNDVISTPLNVELLYNNIKNSVKYHHVIDDDDFSHLDFLHGKDVLPLVYVHILRFLEHFP